MSLEAVQKVTETEQKARARRAEAVEQAKRLTAEAERAGQARLPGDFFRPCGPPKIGAPLKAPSEIQVRVVRRPFKSQDRKVLRLSQPR